MELESESRIGRCVALAMAIFVAAVGVLFAPVSRADAEAGRTLSMSGAPGGVAPCSACHGAEGQGLAEQGFPRLAGQGRAYLVKQLADFRTGRRHNPVMEPIAKALDEHQIGDAAEYFSRLPGIHARLSRSDEPPKTRGERVALRGDWKDGVPGCFSCHGEDGAGVAPHFPAIAGQGARYTAKQLRDWKSGTRANDPQGLMKSVANHLRDPDIDAVADWLASVH